MSYIFSRFRLTVCGLLTLLLAACGGQVESDNLISAAQSQFYAQMNQAPAAQSVAPANQMPLAPEHDSATVTGPVADMGPDGAAPVEAIPAMEIPADSSSTPVSPS